MNFKLQRENFRSKKISAKEAAQEAIVKTIREKKVGEAKGLLIQWK